MKVLIILGMALATFACMGSSEGDVAARLTGQIETFRALRDGLSNDFGEQESIHIGRKRVGEFVSRDGMWFPRGRPEDRVSIEAVAQSIGLQTESLQAYLELLDSVDAEFVQHHPGHAGYASIRVSAAPTRGCSASVHWRATDAILDIPAPTEVPLSRWTALDDDFLIHWFCE